MKKFFIIFLSAIVIFSLTSCSKKDGSSSDDESSSESAKDFSEASEVSEVSEDKSNEDISVAPGAVEKFPDEKMSHSVIDDGDYYLKVRTVSGSNTCLREIAIKGEDAFATVREGDIYKWYYSNGRATFVFDDDSKTYEVASFSPLFIELFSDEIIEEGNCVFFDVECRYVKYALDEKTSIIHLYRKTDDSWLGFQYMVGDEYCDANLILCSSDSYPEYAVFEIPEDYTFYYETGENELSVDDDFWN